jgi:hypothetical protein
LGAQDLGEKGNAEENLLSAELFTIFFLEARSQSKWQCEV